MLQNSYMGTHTQKAFIEGMPGCVEHQFKLATIIQEACKKHRSLAICWLNLTNAYGSVHHKLIQFSMNHYHALTQFVNTVSNMNLRATITTDDFRDSPFRLGFTRVILYLQ